MRREARRRGRGKQSRARRGARRRALRVAALSRMLAVGTLRAVRLRAESLEFTRRAVHTLLGKHGRHFVKCRSLKNNRSINIDIKYSYSITKKVDIVFVKLNKIIK